MRKCNKRGHEINMKLYKHLVMVLFLFSSSFPAVYLSSRRVRSAEYFGVAVFKLSMRRLQHNRNHEKPLCGAWAVASTQLQPAPVAREESCRRW